MRTKTHPLFTMLGLKRRESGRRAAPRSAPQAWSASRPAPARGQRLGLAVMALVLAAPISALAFPSWIGNCCAFPDRVTTGTLYAGDSVQFAILMNQDYSGLHAEVGIDDGGWGTHSLTYWGNSSGNSAWTNVMRFTAGTRSFYFHGWDDWGGNIYDNNGGANYSFTVNALNNPTPGSVTTNTTSLTLNWSKDAQGHNVMIVRSPDASFFTPSQGTAYSSNQTVSGDTVVYNSSGTTYTDTGLTPGETYYYKYFSENWSYYSSGSARTNTTSCFSTAPSGLHASATNVTDFTAAWSSYTGADGYQLDVSTNAAFESGSAGDLLFSQYVETSSGTTPKGVEIWNATGADITFNSSDKKLEIFKGVNGGTPSLDVSVTSGTLSAGDVWVIGTSDMSPDTVKAFTFNGDDSLVLKLGGTTKDVIGNPGSDPGSAWSGGGVSTANQNIQLKSGITEGDTDGWTDPSGRFEYVGGGTTTTGFGTAPSGGGGAEPDYVPGYSNRAVNAGTSQSVTGLTGSTTYYFRLRATNDNNCITLNSTTASVTTVAATPNIALADNGTQVTAASVEAGTDNHVLHKFSLAVTTADAELTAVAFTSAGTYDAADLDNFKVWYSTDNSLETGSDTLLGTISTTLGTGAHSLSSLSQSITAGNTGYIFITADIDAAPTGGNTINVSAVTTANVTFTAGNKSGSTTAGGAQTIITLPAVTTTAASSIAAQSATLGGNVTSEGGDTVSDRGVVYDTASSVTISDNKTQIGSGSGSFGQSIGSLNVNDQYWFRAYAINTVGTTLGTELNFWTLANVPSAPTVDNPTVSTLDVTINVNGNPSTTEFAIRVGGSQYVQTNGTLGGSAVWQTASAWGTVTVSGLSSGTTYGVDVKARNGEDTETAFSSSTNGTTCPAAPTGLSSVTNSTDFEASWSAATGATGYRIDVSTNASFGGGGAANLMSNAGFETGDATDWDTVESGYSVSTTSPNNGTYCMSCVAGSTRDLDQQVAIPTADGSTAYVISYWYRVTAGDGSDVRIWASWNNGAGSGDTLQPGSYNPDTSTWTQIVLTNTPASGATNLDFEIRCYSGSTVYLDDFSVVEDGASGTPNYVPGYSNRTVAAGTSETVTGLTAEVTYYWRVRATGASCDSVNSTTQEVTTVASVAYIALADNGTQVTAANVAAGTDNRILHKFQLTVTNTATTLNGVDFTSAGTYSAGDLDNFKVWYSTDNTLETGSDTLLGTISSSLGAGLHSLSSLSQGINAGDTRYIFITADIANDADASKTINLSAVATGDLTFSAGSKSGSTSAGGAQTITSAVTIDNTGTPGAGNIAAGTTDAVLFGFRISPATGSIDFTGLSLDTAGTADSGDLSNFEVVYDADNSGTYNGGDSIVSSAAQAIGDPISFTITGQTGISAARRYLVIADAASDATAGATFTGGIAAAGDVTTTGTESGTAAGNQQTITGTVAIDNTGTPAAGNIAASTANAVLFGFRLTPSGSVNFTGLSLDTAGTATSGDLSNFEVVYDADNSGTYNGGDSIVSSAAQAIGDPISFTITGQTGFSAARRYLVIADVAASPTAGRTFTGSIAAAGDVTTTGTESGTAAGNQQTIVTLPVVTSPTATSIETTTATLGANVTSLGGTTISANGTVWGTSANPTGNAVDEGSHTTGVFTDGRTGFSQGTKVYYRGYAVNSVGTAYSADGSFYTEPGQASNVQFANIGATTMRITWSAGANSDGAIVVVRAGSSTVNDPTDGTLHSASTTFGSGANLGNSSYVVYRSSGTQVDVTNLSGGTTYYVEVFAYKGTVADSGVDQGINYQQSSPATGNQTTLATEPTTHASSLSFTGVGAYQMTVNWTSGNGANRIVVVRQGSAVSWTPSDGTAPTGVNTNFSLATDKGSGNKICYNGSGSSFTLTGLDETTTYYVKIFEYNGSGSTVNYYTGGTPLSGSQATTAAACVPSDVVLVQQTNYYASIFNDYGGTFNNGGTEVGQWAHDDNTGLPRQTVAWRNFRTDGSGGGDLRELQPGDRFEISVYGWSPYGILGCSLNDGASTGSWANRHSNTRGYIQCGNANGDLYVTYSGGASSWSGIRPWGTTITMVFDILSSGEFTANIEGQTPRYDLTMTNSPGDSDRIDGYSIYYHDDWADGERKNAYWKQDTTITNLGYVEIGAGNWTNTIYGKITDGLDAHCTNTPSPNYVKKSGTGVVTLNNTANSYTLHTEINSGTLIVPADGALGTAPGGTSAQHIRMSSGAAGAALVCSDSFTLNANRGMILSNWSYLAVSSAKTATYNGVIADDAGSYFLVKNQSGELVLGGNSTFDGGTYLDDGTVTLTHANGLGTGSINVGRDTSTESATLKLGAAITVTNTVVLRDGSSGVKTIHGAANAAISGPVQLNENGNNLSVIDVDSGDTLTLSGVLSGSGGGDVTKDGAGILLYSGSSANTFSGVTVVKGGTLNLNKSAGVNAIAANVTVGDGSGNDVLAISTNHQIADAVILTLVGDTANQRGDFHLNGFSETISGLSGTGVVQNISDNAGYLTLNVSGTQTSYAEVRDVYSGGPAGALALIKSGTGTQVLAGAVANTYSGPTTVNGGRLTLSKSSGNAVSSSILTLNNAGSTVLLTDDDQISDSANVTVNAGTTLDLNGNDDAIDILGGSGAVTLGSGTLTLGASGGSSTYSGELSGTGDLVKDGAGTVTLGGSDIDYTGDTTVNLNTGVGLGAPNSGGALVLNGAIASTSVRIGDFSLGGGSGHACLQLGIDNALPSTVDLVFDGDNSAQYAYLKMMGYDLTIAGLEQVHASGGYSSAIIQNTGSGDTVSETAVLTINNSGSETFDGRIRDGSGGGGGGIALVKTGAGTLTFTDELLYTKGTTVQNGTLDLSGIDAYGGGNDGPLTIEGGTLDIGAITYLNALTAFQITGGTVDGSGTITSTGAFDLQAGTVNTPLGGSVGATKSTAGTVTLAGHSTYSGATAVNGGVLVVSGSSSNSAHTVASGATLMGAGAVGNLTIGGLVDPGNTGGARADLGCGTLTLNDGGTMEVDISAASGTAGSDWDLISASGAIAANASGTFTIDLNGTPSGWNAEQSYSWEIMTGASVSDFDAGRFTIDTNGFLAAQNGGSFTMAQVGNDLCVIFVPRVPDAPAAFSATATGLDTIQLAFTRNGDSDDVVIVYDLDGSFTTPSGTVPAVGNPFAGGTVVYSGGTSPQNHTGLDSCTPYYYKVWSYVGTNYSTTGLTDDDTTDTPAAPATVWASDTNETDFTAAWSAATGASGYRLDVSDSSTFEGGGDARTNDCANVGGGTSSSYLTRIWTNNTDVVWTAYKARTDQTVNGDDSVCLRDESGAYISTPDIPSGIATLQFTVQQKYSGSGGQLTVYVNGSSEGTFDYDTNVQTAEFNSINVDTVTSLVISNNTSARPAINNLIWTDTGGAAYVAGFSNLYVAGTSQSVTGLTSGSTYYFRVRPEGDGGCTGVNSTTASVTTVAVPSIALADNGTQVAAADVEAGTTAHVLHKFQLSVTVGAATLTNVSFTSAGTYAAADLDKFQVWYSTDNSLNTGSDTQLGGDLTTGLGAGPHEITCSQLIAKDATGYIFITADIDAAPTYGNEINVNAITTGDVRFSDGNKSGSTTAGGTQRIIAAEPTTDASGLSFTAVGMNQMTVNWTSGNGANRIVVVREGAATSWTPSDGTAPSGVNTNFSSASDQGSGNKICYDGPDSSFTLTGLDPGTQYAVTIFEYNGTGAYVDYYTGGTPLAGSEETICALPPANVIASHTNYTSFTSAWDTATGATGYFLDVSTNATFSYSAGGPATNAYHDGNLGTGTGGIWTEDDVKQGSGYIIMTNAASLVATPAMNFTLGADQTLNFRARTYGGTITARNTITVSVSTNNGSTWASLGTRVPTTSSLTAMTPFDLSTYDFTQVMVKFETLGATGNVGVGIDDILVTNLLAASTGYVPGYSNRTVAGTSQVVTGLTEGATYYFRVRSETATCTSDHSATQSVTTLINYAAEPTVQAHSLWFTSIGSESLAVNWTNGNGSDRILVAHEGAAVDSHPADGTPYAAHSEFGGGAQIGTGNYVLYKGDGSGPVTVTGLDPLTTYHFRVYEYNGSGYGINYLTNSASGNPASQATYDYAPGFGYGPATLTASTTVGSNPGNGSFTVTNVGGAELTYDALTNAAWLSVSPAAVSGKTNGETQVHSVSYDLSGLTAGVYSATITLTNSGTAGNVASNSPQTVSVIVTNTAIPDPTSGSATADGKTMVRLAWQTNATYNTVMIVWRGDGPVGEAAQGTSYAVGNAIVGGWVIYKGTGTNLEHVVASGTTNDYRIYSVNNNHYSPGVRVAVTNGSFEDFEVVETFSYTNSLALTGHGGEKGWGGSWYGDTSLATNSKGSFGTQANYPNPTGNKLFMSPANDAEIKVYRPLGQIYRSDRIYFGYIMNYAYEGADKYAGLSLMWTNNEEKLFIGEIGSQDEQLGIDSTGSAQSLTHGTGNDYVIVGYYDWAAGQAKASAYKIGTDTVPESEPGSWDVTVSKASNTVGWINTIRLASGETGAGSGTPGNTYFDEVRISTNWSDLLTVVPVKPLDPTDVTATVDGAEMVRLAWSTNAAGNGVMVLAKSAPTPTFLVDFGRHDSGTNGDATTSPDANGNYWNNIGPTTQAVTNGTQISNLVTTNNGSSSVGIEMTSEWDANGLLNGGLFLPFGPSNSLLGAFAVETATEDYFFTTGTDTFKITGLDTGATYRLRFFGTRSNTSTRTTTYTVGSDSTNLTTSGSGIGTYAANQNDDTIALLSGLTPNGSGEIAVSVTATAGGFGYLGVLEIQMETAGPVDGTGYSAGGTVDDYRIIYKGTAQSLEHVVDPGTTNSYRFYSYTAANLYSTGVTVSVTNPAYGVSERVNPFSYTNGVSPGTTTKGGQGFGANYWVVDSGTWTVRTNYTTAVTDDTPAFFNMNNYPDMSGNLIYTDITTDGGTAKAQRSLDSAVSTGTFYVAFMMSYQYYGANKWAGISLLNSSGTEKAFMGKGGGANWSTLGIGDGTTTYWSAFDFAQFNSGNGDTGNVYMVVGKYDFDTSLLAAKAYKIIEGDDFPDSEPTWDVSQTITSIDSIGRIQLNAGATGGSGYPGKVFYDEIRYATNWAGLVATVCPSWSGSNFFKNAEWTAPGSAWLGDSESFMFQSYPVGLGQYGGIEFDWDQDGTYGTYLDMPWLQNANNNSYWSNKIQMTTAGVITSRFVAGGTSCTEVQAVNPALTVQNLNPPTDATAVRDGTLTNSQINLTWTRGVSGAAKDVLVVRQTADSGWTAPSNTTTYNAGDPLGANGTVVYRGDLEAFNDGGLAPNTTFYYRFYTENWTYYSLTYDEASASTAPGGQAIVIDGNPADWVGSPSPVLDNSASSLQEFIWTDKRGDMRPENTDHSNGDISEFRVFADDTWVYFLVKMTNITDVTKPYVAIGVDTRTNSATTWMDWLGDDAGVFIGSNYAQSAAAHFPEYQLNVHYVTAATGPRIEMYRHDGTYWEAPASGNTNAAISATYEAIEFKVARADLNLTGTTVGRFTVASYLNTGAWNNDGDGTVQLMENTADMIDTLSIPPWGTRDNAANLSAWLEDISDANIDFWADVKFAAAGLTDNSRPSTPVLSSPAGEASVTANPTLSWAGSTDSDGEVTGYLLEVSTNQQFNGVSGTENGTVNLRVHLDAATTSYDLSTTSTQYWWRVRSRDTAGQLSTATTRWFRVVDKLDVEGPQPTLVYIGTDVQGYLDGDYDERIERYGYIQDVLDSEIRDTNNVFGFVLRWEDPSGVYATNKTHSGAPGGAGLFTWNIVSDDGRVSPNWDIAEYTNGVYSRDWDIDEPFYASNTLATGNGDTDMTNYVHAAFSMTNYDPDVEYYLTVSAEDGYTEGGSWWTYGSWDSYDVPDGAPHYHRGGWCDDGPNTVRNVTTNFLIRIVVRDDDIIAPQAATGAGWSDNRGLLVVNNGTNYPHSGQGQDVTYVLTDGAIYNSSLQFQFNIYDPYYEGVAYGTATTYDDSGRTVTNSSLTVVNWITNNTANFSAGDSVLDDTAEDDTVLTWNWAALTADDVSELWGAAEVTGAAGDSNQITLAAFDLDNDRLIDQAWQNLSFGWLQVEDDDRDPPEVVELTLNGVGGSGVSNLLAGAIALIGVNGNSANDTSDINTTHEHFSFVVLAPFPAGTTLWFTDCGWDGRNGSTNWWDTAEFHLASYTSAGNGDVGQVFDLNITDINSAGDQVALYQYTGVGTPSNDPANVTFIYAINIDLADGVWDGWEADTVDPADTDTHPPDTGNPDNEESAMYKGLTNGATAVSVTSTTVNVRYDGPTEGSASFLLAQISESTNWTTGLATGTDHVFTNIEFNVTGAGDFDWNVPTLTDGEVREGGYLVTNIARDMESGIVATNNAIAHQPYFVMLNTNSEVVVSNEFNTDYATGDMQDLYTNTVNALTGDYSRITLGVMDLLVAVADADVDRNGDSLFSSNTLSVAVIDDDPTEPELSFADISGSGSRDYLTSGDEILFYDFGATDEFTTQPTRSFLSVGTVDPLTANGAEPGSQSGNPGEAANATDWNDATNYWAFNINMLPGFELDMQSIQFDYYCSGTGPNAWALRSSADSYASVLASGALTRDSSWYTINAALASNPDSGTVTYRLYGSGATSGGGTWRLDNLSFTGEVDTVAGAFIATDSDLNTNGLSMAASVHDTNSGIFGYTHATLKPTYDLMTPTGVTASNQAFGTGPADGEAQASAATLAVSGGVAYADIVLGTYTAVVQAVDYDDDRIDDRLSTTVTSVFSVVDDDVYPPQFSVARGTYLSFDGQSAGSDANAVTDGMLTNGLTISNRIYDARSGVDADTVQFRVQDPEGWNSGLEDFTTRPGDGGAKTSQWTDASTTVFEGDFDVELNVGQGRALGVWTCTFYAVDFDDDRPNDSTSTTQSFEMFVIDDDKIGPRMASFRSMDEAGAVYSSGFESIDGWESHTAGNWVNPAGSSFKSYLIDFGRHNDGATHGHVTASPDANGLYWNSFSPPSDPNPVYAAVTNGSRLDNLVSTNNQASSISIVITSAGWGANGLQNGGLLAPSNSLLGHFAVETATEDFFYTEWSDETLKITGLDPDYLYNLRMFGSRDTTMSRKTEYLVMGQTTQTVYLVSSGSGVGEYGYNGNNNNIRGVNGIRPNASGEIALQVGVVAPAQFSYLNVLEIQEAPWVSEGAYVNSLNARGTDRTDTGFKVGFNTVGDILELPPVDKPGWFTVWARNSGGSGTAQWVLEEYSGGSWNSLGTRSVSGEEYAMNAWLVDSTNWQNRLRLRMTTLDGSIYFDDLVVTPYRPWTNQSMNITWDETDDTQTGDSGLGEYRMMGIGGTPPVYSTNGTSLGSSQSSALTPSQDHQGMVTGHVFAVDGDTDRGDRDRAMGFAVPAIAKFDITPPTGVPMPADGASTDNVDDPTTQFDITWIPDEVGPDDPNLSGVYPTWGGGSSNLLSPWKTYKIYYGTFNPLDVPPGDPGHGSGSAYIYTNFLANGVYTNWPCVTSTNAITDPLGAGTNYAAMGNVDQGTIRLYDLEFDQDYAVVIVGLDEAGNECDPTPSSWATNNTIKFAVTSGWMVAKTFARDKFGSNVATNTSATNTMALGWLAAGPTNEQGQLVTKDYDLIYWDAPTFEENTNNNWQLVDTVQSNWFVDDGGQFKSRGDIRFYRASYKDRWQKTRTVGSNVVSQRPLASEEIYALHNVILSPGQNFVALHGVPYTNTFHGVFGGTETFPGGGSQNPAIGSTIVEFYSPGTNAPVSEQFWLNAAGDWIRNGTNVTHTVQSADFFGRGFSINLPPATSTVWNVYQTTTAYDYQQYSNGAPAQVPAMIWSPILQVPTNDVGFSRVIQTGRRSGRVSTNVYNLVALRLPVAVHPDELRLRECGFMKGPVNAADHIYTINTATKSVLNGSTIYCDVNGVWRYVSGNGLVPAGYFKPNDVIVIVSRNEADPADEDPPGSGNWTWSYHPTNFYQLPTRWMEPAE